MQFLITVVFFISVIVSIQVGSFFPFLTVLVLSFGFAAYKEWEAAAAIKCLRIAYHEALAGNNKAEALELGRAYYRAKRRDGSLTIYDEQAINNDLETMN